MKFDIVFEGGGAKGLAHVGAMEAFDTEKYQIGRLVGTSAGAMTAGLLAAGFTTEELREAAQEKLPDGRPVFAAFMEVPESFSRKTVENSFLNSMLKAIDWWFIPKWIQKSIDDRIMAELMKSTHFKEAFSFVERGGLYSGDAMYQFLHDKLDSKSGLGKATFAEFNEQTNADLTVIASDTEGNRELTLNHRTSPKCPVAWAIRMSMNLPFVWQEVLWKAEWGPYRGDDISGHTIVDGGMISNFPLNLLVSDDRAVEEVMGTLSGNEVFGLILNSDNEVPQAPPRSLKTDGHKDNLLDRSKVIRRVERLIDTITTARDKFIITAHEDLVCNLPVKGYGTTEFNMSPERIQALINGGRDAATDYFDKRFPNEPEVAPAATLKTQGNL